MYEKYLYYYFHLVILYRNLGYLQQAKISIFLFLKLKKFSMDRALSKSRYSQQYSTSSFAFNKHHSQRSVKHISFHQKITKIEDNLLKEIGRADQIIKQAQSLAYSRAKGTKTLLQELQAKQDLVRRKDETVQLLQNEIKRIKTTSLLFDPDFFHQQVKGKCIQLSKEMHRLREKREELQKYYKQTKRTEQKYLNMCSKRGFEGITFEQFARRYKKRVKEIKAKTKNLDIKRSKEKDKNQQNLQTINQQGDILQSQKVREVLTQKKVIEAAIKAEKKKHKNQMYQCHNKLQFLEDEDTQMDNRLRLKHRELSDVEGKIKQKKVITRKDSLRTVREAPS